MSTPAAPPPAVPPPEELSALVIQPLEKATLIRLPGGSRTFEAIRDLVGGYVVEVAVSGSHWVISVNEDGGPLGLKANVGIDLLARMLGVRFRAGDYLRGPAVLLGRDGFAYADVPADVLALARQAGVLA
jgi:hypothetical protein